MWPIIIYLVYLKCKHPQTFITHTHTHTIDRYVYISITFGCAITFSANGALVSLIYPFKYNMCVRSVEHFMTSLFFLYQYSHFWLFAQHSLNLLLFSFITVSRLCECVCVRFVFSLYLSLSISIFSILLGFSFPLVHCRRNLCHLR